MPNPISTKFYESNRPKLGTGVIIGHTTDTSTRIWARTYRTGDWWMVLARVPLTGDLQRLGERSVQEYLDGAGIAYAAAAKLTFTDLRDNTNTFEFDQLQAGTRYYYYLIAESLEVPRRTEVGFDSPQSFRTLPEKPTELSFGFYSCHDPFSVTGHTEGLWAPFYELLTQRQADFVIGGGDQVYVDTNRPEDMPDLWRWLKENKPELVRQFSRPDGTLKTAEITAHFVEIYHQYYRFYWAFPNLLRTYKSFPQYMMWDDHEILDGWGSLTVKERARRLNRLLQDDDPKINEQLVDCLFQAAATGSSGTAPVSGL